MKYLIILGALLWLLLSWFANSVGLKAEEVTTNNLLDQNFDNGSWSGTADGRHGSTIIAAEDGEYIQSDNVSLSNDANLTEAQIQDGYTTTHSFKYWHWNNYDSTVQSTVTITGSDGETTTQIRKYDSTGCGYNNCGSYNTGIDTLSISRNTQTDYNLNVRYDFSDTSTSSGHWSVDLKEPSLTVTYESKPLDYSIQEEIENIFEDLNIEEDINLEQEVIFLPEPELIDMKAPEENFEMVAMEEPEFEQEFFEEEIVMEMKEEVVKDNSMDTPMFASMPEEEIIEETNELISSFLPPPEEEPAMEEEMVDEEPTMKEEEMIEEEPKEMASAPAEEREEVIEESTTEEESKEMAQPNNEPKEKIKEKKSTSKVAKKSTVQSKKLAKQKDIQQKKAIRNNLVKVMDKVDKDIKDISKNLQIKNIIKLDAMMSEQASLDSYDIPFYKSKDIYMDQLQIEDMRQLYTDVSLNNYIANDPVVIMESKLRDIETKKQLLIIELEALKNG